MGAPLNRKTLNGSLFLRKINSPVLTSLACILLSFGLFLTGCLGDSESKAATSTPGLPGETPAGAGWYTIYFTDPGDTRASFYRGGPDEKLASAIGSARVSVDAAIYDLNLWSIRDALVDAHQRGLTVRVVTESDNLDKPEIRELENEGIPVLGDRREGLMHNKFIVIDRQEVWTGSMNFTTTDGYLNNNNLVRMQSNQLALDYTVEFEEMFRSDLFGPDGRSDTPEPDFEIGSSRVEVYFSPEDGTERRLVELVDGAQHSIYFLAFSFTSDPLSQAMLDRAASGVVVSGVFEETQVDSNLGSEYERLSEKGLDVRLDGNPRNMHHKVLIIDEKVVIFGSYNFSKSAETRNDENTLILHDEAAAKQFVSEFERILANSHR